MHKQGEAVARTVEGFRVRGLAYGLAALVSAAGLAVAAPAAAAEARAAVSFKNATVENNVRFTGSLAVSTVGSNNKMDTNLGLNLKGVSLENTRVTNNVRFTGSLIHSIMGSGNKSTLNLGVSATN